MAAAAGAFSWLTEADEFELDLAKVSVSGVHYTDLALVQSTVTPWVEGRPNLFRLALSDMELALEELPAVAATATEVVLPDRLVISLVERVPVFVWASGAKEFLVDSEGVLLRELSEGEQPRGELPRVEDRRSSDEPLLAGESLDEVDRDAVVKLAALDPVLLGSRASHLALAVDDEDGFVLSADANATGNAELWRAVFGHYTPTLRPPEIIEHQVQCLRSLLAEHDESQLEAVYLSPADDRCGTFRAAPSPTPEEGE